MLVFVGLLATAAGTVWFLRAHSKFSREVTKAWPTQASCRSGETLVVMKRVAGSRTSYNFYCESAPGRRRALSLDEYGPSLAAYHARLGAGIGGVLLGTLLLVLGGRGLRPA